MTTLPVPRGNFAVKSDTRESSAGRRAMSGAIMRMSFGRAFQGDHAVAFEENARRVPIDSAAAHCASTCAGTAVRAMDARAGRRAATARG